MHKNDSLLDANIEDTRCFLENMKKEVKDLEYETKDLEEKFNGIRRKQRWHGLFSLLLATGIGIFIAGGIPDPQSNPPITEQSIDARQDKEIDALEARWSSSERLAFGAHALLHQIGEVGVEQVSVDQLPFYTTQSIDGGSGGFGMCICAAPNEPEPIHCLDWRFSECAEKLIIDCQTKLAKEYGAEVTCQRPESR